jgi:hypothetical protein
MSNSVSPSRPLPEANARSARPYLRAAACWALGILWAVLLVLRFAGAGPEDSVAACRDATYRDPVTGREQGIGSARVAQDGTMTCHGMTYRIGAR